MVNVVSFFAVKHFPEALCLRVNQPLEASLSRTHICASFIDSLTGSRRTSLPASILPSSTPRTSPDATLIESSVESMYHREKQVGKNYKKMHNTYTYLLSQLSNQQAGCNK